jgi:hypothetical protein
LGRDQKYCHHENTPALWPGLIYLVFDCSVLEEHCCLYAWTRLKNSAHLLPRQCHCHHGTTTYKIGGNGIKGQGGTENIVSTERIPPMESRTHSEKWTYWLTV